MNEEFTEEETEKIIEMLNAVSEDVVKFALEIIVVNNKCLYGFTHLACTMLLHDVLYTRAVHSSNVELSWAYYITTEELRTKILEIHADKRTWNISKKKK